MIKQTTIYLALVATIALCLLNFACSKQPEIGSEHSSPTATVTPLVKASPIPGSADLVSASSSGDISYEFAGIEDGDSTKMHLKVNNKTERVWELKIEVGTKLEPSEGDVQQMVVTKELEVHLEPHDEETIEVEVGCLEISKAPPSQANTSWRLQRSQNLNSFISCASQAIDAMWSEGIAKDQERSDLMQGALWSARGATREEWIHFYQEYNRASREAAEERVIQDEAILKRITGRCPSI